MKKLSKIEEQKNLKELKSKFVEKLKRIEELDKKKSYLQRQGQRKSKFLPQSIKKVLNMNALLALHSGQNQKQTDYSLLGLMNFKSLREKIAESPLKEVVNRGNFYLKKNISKNIYLFKEFQANLKAKQELTTKLQ